MESHDTGLQSGNETADPVRTRNESSDTLRPRNKSGDSNVRSKSEDITSRVNKTDDSTRTGNKGAHNRRDDKHSAGHDLKSSSRAGSQRDDKSRSGSDPDEHSHEQSRGDKRVVVSKHHGGNDLRDEYRSGSEGRSRGGHRDDQYRTTSPVYEKSRAGSNHGGRLAADSSTSANKQGRRDTLEEHPTHSQRDRATFKQPVDVPVKYNKRKEKKKMHRDSSSEVSLSRSQSPMETSRDYGRRESDMYYSDAQENMRGTPPGRREEIELVYDR